MSLPHSTHFFNRNSLGLRQEELDEECHHQHEEREEKEQAKLEVAQHVQEHLRNQECEQHVDRNIHTLCR